MNHLRPSSLSPKYFASTGLVFSYWPLFFEHHHILLSQLKLVTDSVCGAFSNPSHGVAALFQLFPLHSPHGSGKPVFTQSAFYLSLKHWNILQ